jgi:hypothetical protein
MDEPGAAAEKETGEIRLADLEEVMRFVKADASTF